MEKVECIVKIKTSDPLFDLVSNTTTQIYPLSYSTIKLKIRRLFSKLS